MIKPVVSENLSISSCPKHTIEKVSFKNKNIEFYGDNFDAKCPECKKFCEGIYYTLLHITQSKAEDDDVEVVDKTPIL